ncbi:T9SS type B sorting domain-containing protein [Flavobacterium salilacus subsp. salilacus]|uniref:T9SS type B sorting domain-containing protein n=1 Tax=Flavobacterium TaxID=237 RepID=UPI0013C2EE45|nr:MULTISPECIES: T9SS type B sorting domain-containing protein [Flavobacterium]KAF2516813.1 T9SS type B sorting domain-containing protein [Flavobacterium salilacus subsp. salilacus]MBE1615828.1 T9SS type B sorting domain-containing protein [Flavobacterium sp. SaA2.13]
MKLFKFLLIIVSCFTISAQTQQLADFDLQVTKTNETCLGNGTLSFVTTNLTPGSQMIYKVYLLPDLVNPVSISVDTYLAGLSAGTYRVEAIQVLEDLSNSQQQQITINENIIPFNFTVSSAYQNCAGGADIIVNVSSGISSAYEIISGPVIRPLQTSNVFSGLPSGTYNIRAFNDCGIGKVRTYTLVVTASELAISDTTYPDEVVIVCDSITVNNIISATSGVIGYPVTVRHTLNTMDIGGNPTIINQTFASGPSDFLEVSAVVPRYPNNSYSYELTVTDNCNAVYEKLENVVNPDIDVSLSTGDASCAEKYLVVDVSKFYNSFTIEFLSFPDGFNPVVNSSYTDGHVEFGDSLNSIPFGNYVVSVTDECGRTMFESIMIELQIPEPNIIARNNGCFSEFGRIRINVIDSELTTATVIAAPSDYNNPLPHNVTGNINNQGILALSNMPVGFYTIQFTDDCGFFREEIIEVPPFVEQDFNKATLPSCDTGYGSVRLRSGNGYLSEVIITSAPIGLGQSLPYDVSFNIEAGKFYMGNLPQGLYIFKTTDVCDITHDMEVYIAGYNLVLEESFEFIPNCGSFSVKVTDESNGNEGGSYWLQKLDTETGNWIHPQTGVAYTEGNLPDSDTGIKLVNSTIKNNLGYTGTFRILKKFETFSSGTAQNTICIGELGQFSYDDGLSIGSAYTMACVGEPNDVYLEATGYPVSFTIIEKDGIPVFIDNGTSNIFKDLEPAVYVFSVEDGCGNIVTQWFNFQELPSIAAANQPDDMLVCAEPGMITNHEFHLTDQDEQILGPLFSAMYTITYHLTQQDADSGSNSLPEYYTNISNGQTIYVRLVHNEIDICHSTTSFRLFTGEYQEPAITTTGTVCDGIDLALTANSGYSSYLWSTGETTRTIYVDEPGIYSVIVEKSYGTEVCDGFTEIEIGVSEKPEIVRVETTDWTQDENTITVYIEGDGNYEYSVDGMNFQESNVFENLETGIYNVMVRDIYGCGEDSKEVVLMYYPKFFTPNGDGVNEKWYIKYAFVEPNFKVAIYDRYGKLIAGLNATSDGWDGTLQGANLPSTDYWFVVTREDGREYKGHFSMVR